jgi:putative ABC transport system permease protein
VRGVTVEELAGEVPWSSTSGCSSPPRNLPTTGMYEFNGVGPPMVSEIKHLRTHHSGIGGMVAVASIVALGSCCLAGSPLYLSSVATAALQSELGRTCLADVGLKIGLDGVQPDVNALLVSMAAPLAAHTQPSVLTRVAPFISVVGSFPGATPFNAVLVYRDNQEKNLLRPVKSPRDNEVLAPEAMSPPRGTAPGDVLTLSATYQPEANRWTLVVKVADTYPLVPTRPESAYWCGLRDRFRPDALGNRPPPVLFTTSTFLRTADIFQFAEFELRPDPVGLTRHDAAVLADRFDEVVAAARGIKGFNEGVLGSAAIDGGPLRLVARHATTAETVVAGTMAPVRLVTLLSSLTLLGAATTLLARERRRELRLRLMKGESPWTLGLRIARRAASAVIIGTLAGGFCAWAAVKALGPATDLEPAAVHSAITALVLGSAVAFVVIACVAASRVRMFVDARPTRRSLARFVPWELIAVAAAIAAFARLDRIGGIQQIGAVAKHGDFWAQCFPLLAIIAPLALAVRPTIALLRRWRLAGSRLPPSVLIGLRRSFAEPGVTAAVMLATALAAGSFTLAQLLTDSTQVMLSEKAAVFLGSDLSINTDQATVLPPPLDAIGTVVSRTQARSGSQSVDLLGIDRESFARAVHWRDDASDRSLDELIAALGAPTSGPAPAIVVGGKLPDVHLTSLTNRPIEVAPVATARWFPGLNNGAILVVVDKHELPDAGLTTGSEIWLRDPPRDVLAQLSQAGITVRSHRDLAQVFNVTSFLTVRWAYATLSTLSVLVGIVVILAQLLVLDARRQTRQASHVMTTRMGLTTPGEMIGLIAELGPALAIGAALGVGIGWVVSRLSVARLDTLRQLRPPARVVAHPSTAPPVILGVLGAIAVLVAVGTIMNKRTPVMEVMRGTA